MTFSYHDGTVHYSSWYGFTDRSSGDTLVLTRLCLVNVTSIRL